MRACPEGEEVHDDRCVYPFESARSTGLLWAINKVLMHPRGFALTWEYPESATPEEIVLGAVAPCGFSVAGDGTEAWQFEEGLDDRGFERFETFLAEHRAGGA
jgi:hypothetical protein